MNVNVSNCSTITLDTIFYVMEKNIKEIKYLYVGARGDRSGEKGKYFSSNQFQKIYHKYNNILKFGHDNIKFELSKIDMPKNGCYLDMPFTDKGKRKTLYFIFKP